MMATTTDDSERLRLPIRGYSEKFLLIGDLREKFEHLCFLMSRVYPNFREEAKPSSLTKFLTLSPGATPDFLKIMWLSVDKIYPEKDPLTASSKYFLIYDMFEYLVRDCVSVLKSDADYIEKKRPQLGSSGTDRQYSYFGVFGAVVDRIRKVVTLDNGGKDEQQKQDPRIYYPRQIMYRENCIAWLREALNGSRPDYFGTTYLRREDLIINMNNILVPKSSSLGEVIKITERIYPNVSKTGEVSFSASVLTDAGFFARNFTEFFDLSVNSELSGPRESVFETYGMTTDEIRNYRIKKMNFFNTIRVILECDLEYLKTTTAPHTLSIRGN